MLTGDEGEIFPTIYLVTVVLLMIYAVAGALFEIKHVSNSGELVSLATRDGIRHHPRLDLRCSGVLDLQE